MARKKSSFSKELRSVRGLVFFYRAEIRIILLPRKYVLMNIRPNRDDSDHVLIVAIDIDLGYERTIRGASHWAHCRSGAILSRILFSGKS
jgi:hypothetical protein